MATKIQKYIKETLVRFSSKKKKQGESNSLPQVKLHTYN